MRVDATREDRGHCSLIVCAAMSEDWTELDATYAKALARRAGMYFWTAGSGEFHWIRDCPVLTCGVASGGHLVTSAEPPSSRTAPTCSYCFGCLPDPVGRPPSAAPCRRCGCPRGAHNDDGCCVYWQDYEFILFTGQYGSTEVACPCDGYCAAAS